MGGGFNPIRPGEQARKRAVHDAKIVGDLWDVWRAPTGIVSGGMTKRLEGVKVATFATPKEGRLAEVITQLAGGRQNFTGMAPWGTDIKAGDELRSPDETQTIHVLGAAPEWETDLPLALSWEKA